MTDEDGPPNAKLSVSEDSESNWPQRNSNESVVRLWDSG